MSTPAFPTRIGFEQAASLLDAVAAAARLPVESRSVSRCLGAVLAEDVVAAICLPGFDNAAMDGFAVRANDTAQSGATLDLVGSQFAGRDQGHRVGAGECLRITTGAPLPAGADAVVMKEDVRVLGNRVVLSGPARPGQHVRRAGEDVAIGDRVLAAGEVLTPGALGLAAALGRATLPVHRRPTVAVFTTGDELVPAGQPLQPGQIHDSNRVLLQSLLLADGYEPVAWPVLPDDEAHVAAALRDAAFSFDVVITCGGVSAGERDLLPDFLAREGTVHFWKVRMRPGMPLLAGRLGDAQLLCLPGNPVSVLATYLTLGRRLLDGMQGRGTPRPRWQARLASDFDKRHDRLEFLRGRLQSDGAGGLQVQPDPADGSHRLRAVAQSDALIVLAEGARHFSAGAVVDVLPLGRD